MAETEKKEPKDPRMETLIRAYDALPIRAKAELRRLEDYQDVPILAGEAYWRCQKAMKGNSDKAYRYPAQVLSALLILFRDRGAGSELVNSEKRLGKLFSGDEQETPVKMIRFKRLMAAEELSSGFEYLRPLLRLFRHDPINWSEVADFLNAMHWQNPKQLNFIRKRLADAYFENMVSKNE